MADTVSNCSVSAGISGTINGAQGTLTTINSQTATANLNPNTSFPSGTGTGQVSGAYRADRTTSGTIDTIALNSLTDSIGNATGFLHIGGLLISNPNPVGGTVTLNIAPAASNPVTWGQLPAAGITVEPMAYVLIISPSSSLPCPSTAGSIQVTTPGVSNFSYAIDVIGRNA